MKMVTHDQIENFHLIIKREMICIHLHIIIDCICAKSITREFNSGELSVVSFSHKGGESM